MSFFHTGSEVFSGNVWLIKSGSTKLKILHLAPDEKFMPFIIEAFDSMPSVKSKYLLIGNKKSKLGNEEFDNSTRVYIDRLYCGSGEMKSDMQWCDCLIVHFMNPLSAQVVSMVPQNITVVWSGWGGDYELPLEKLIGKKTKALLSKTRKSKRTAIRISRLLNIAKELTRKTKAKYFIKKAIYRADYFSSPIPEDYLNLQNRLGRRFKAQFAQLNYGSVEGIFSKGPSKIKGDNILLGNSATATNNHMEVFDLLRGLELGQKKIVMPLSYGDQAYREEIIRKGKELFGERLVCLEEFLPLEEYSGLIAECSIVVMGHKRQQALGNIISMLYKGAKVFLDRDSAAYKYFSRIGIRVFTLDQLSADQAFAFKCLPETDIENNKRILRENWGHEVVIKNIQNLVDRVNYEKILPLSAG